MEKTRNNNTESKAILCKRLRTYRLMNGMSMNELVSRLDIKISAMAISKYERGLISPSTDVLSAIAKLFGIRSEEFLLPFGAPIVDLEFRKDIPLSRKKITAVEKTVQSYLQQHLSLMNECGISVNPFKYKKTLVHNEADVIKLASKVRQQWKIEECIPNVISMLESKGLILYEIVEKEDEFDGISGKAGEYSVIAIRKNLTSEMKRFTALHELGHIMMEFSEDTKQATIEKLCHKFAFEMLLPMEKLKGMVQGIGSRKLSLFEFAQIQVRYGISIDIMLKNLAQKKIISSEQYDNYKEKKERIPEFRQYAVKSRYTEETCELYREVLYRAHTNGVLSEDRAAHYLNLHTVSFVDRYQLF